MSENNELLNKGVEAARAGDRETARKYFEQVLETDEENTKAWWLLYRVVDNQDEKRICLTTILQLDPSNERARQALAKMDAQAEKTKADEEVLPGVTRRQLRLILGAGALVVLLIVVVVVLIISNRNAQIAAQQAALAQAQTESAALANTQSAEQTRMSIAGTETQIALASPTFTASPTSSRPTLPPENTATPSPTVPAAATALPYPDGVPGSIVAWSGRDIENNDFLPIVLFPLAGRGQSTRIGDNTGRYPTIHPGGQRVIYTRYFAATFDYSLEAVNVNGTQPEELGQRWRGSPDGNFIKAEMPVYSANGEQIVFVAVAADTNTTEVYLLNLNVQGTGAIVRLTNDTATYTYPALSPDGSEVAVVRNDRNSINAGEDIVVINIASKAVRALTTDLGTFKESSPRWSPDGLQIAYAAAPANDPNNSDIVVINSDGSGTPLVPVRSPANDIFPVYSPDGRFLAFASNRTNVYDIFIYEFATGNMWQLTNSPEEDYPGGWSAS